MAPAIPQPSYGIKPRVVIVDDHPPFRHAVGMLLAARGYDVVGGLLAPRPRWTPSSATRHTPFSWTSTSGTTTALSSAAC